MGIGGFINSVKNKAAEVIHSGENVVKNTVKTAEKVVTNPLPTVKQFNSVAENMTSRILGSDPVSNLTHTASNFIKPILPPVPPPIPSPVRNFVQKSAEVGGNLLDGAKEIGKNVLNRAIDSGRSLVNGFVEGTSGFFRSVGEGLFQAGKGFLQTLNPAPLAKVFQGDFSGAFNDFKNNLSNGVGNILGGTVKATVQSVVDTAVVGLSSTVSAVQTLIGVETPSRSLTEAETAELRKVYGNSIDYSQIRIKEGNLGIANGLAPHTVGNTIYIPPGWLDPNNQTQRSDLLAHETAHVWQYQNGGTDYIGESLWNQAKGWLSGQSRNAAYEFETPIKNGVSWSEFNPEQQAHLMEEAYHQGLFTDPNAKFMYNGSDYTAFVRDAIDQMRNGQGAP